MGVANCAAGVLALGINVGAYLAEVFRAGIQSVPKGQLEAAWILGISLTLIATGYFIRTLKSRNWVLRLLNIDGLHFLLYLCAFEIVPIMVLIQLMKRTI